MLLNVTAAIKNDRPIQANEIVFLSIRDLVGSYTKPVK